MLILVLLACSEPEPSRVAPAPVSEERALSAYDQAMEERRGEDWEGALTSLLLAIDRDPESPSLWLWLSQTHLDAGQEDLALGVLDEAVRLFPDNATCLYNRAALRARAGEIGGAADDLKRLKALGQLDPLETGADPDFVDLRDDPVFAELVEPPRIQALAAGEEGAVLLGEPWELEIKLSVPSKGTLELSWEGPRSPLLQLESVIEQELRDTARERTLELRVRWRATRPGVGSVGPWTLRHGQAEARVEAMPIEVASLGPWEDRGSPDQLASIPTPRSLIESVDERGVAHVGEWYAISLGASQTLRSEVELEPILLEWRSYGGAVERAQAFRVETPIRLERVQAGQVESSFELP
jgi:hypothetical protein